MSRPKSVGRQVESLRARLVKEQQEHAKTVAAKNSELRTLRDSWELFDTFPGLENLLTWLHKVRDAGSVLKPSSYEARGSGVSDPTGRFVASNSPDLSRIVQVNRDIDFWTRSLQHRLSPKGPLVDDEIPDLVKPRCHNPECPARLIAQAFDQEICYECKNPFTEFRPSDVKTVRCWTRGCVEYGKAGRCLHSWQKGDK